MPKGVYKRSDECRKRLSEAHIGVKFSDEHRDKISEALKLSWSDPKIRQQRLSSCLKGKDHPRYGKKASNETKQKLRESHIGKQHSLETRKKMSVAQIGIKKSVEHVEAVRKALKGRKTGKHSWNWNPDREKVAKNKVANYAVRKWLEIAIHKNVDDDAMIKNLGYSKESLFKRLESTFQSGMNWQSHGRGKDKWHIDHIKPVYAFVKEGITDPKIVNALENLQALWEKDNLQKGAKYNPLWKELRYKFNLLQIPRAPTDMSIPRR